MLVTDVLIVPGASPRANWRAATRAAWCSLDWCMPTTMTLMSMAMTRTMVGRMTAKSAVTETADDFVGGGRVAPRVAGGSARDGGGGLETQRAFDQTLEQALYGARRQHYGKYAGEGYRS